MRKQLNKLLSARDAEKTRADRADAFNTALAEKNAKHEREIEQLKATIQTTQERVRTLEVEQSEQKSLKLSQTTQLERLQQQLSETSELLRTSEQRHEVELNKLRFAVDFEKANAERLGDRLSGAESAKHETEKKLRELTSKTSSPSKNAPPKTNPTNEELLDLRAKLEARDLELAAVRNAVQELTQEVGSLGRKLDFAYAGRLESERAHGEAMGEMKKLEGKLQLHALSQ